MLKRVKMHLNKYSSYEIMLNDHRCKSIINGSLLLLLSI